MCYDRGMFYKFCFAVSHRLQMQFKCVQIEFIKNKYIKLQHIDEFIYIPLRNFGFITILYEKDGVLLDTYSSEMTGHKYYHQLWKYLNWHEKRNYYRILKNDDETKAYF